MRLEIDFTKSMHENASAYYDAAKKAKKKLSGLSRGMAVVESKLGAGNVVQKKKAPLKKRERKWYEKYHWMFTSQGFLVIGGRDARGNEQIVTKLMEDRDVYFHADIHGAPHVILKTEGRVPGEASLGEAATFAAVFSRGWQEQIPALDVYSVPPAQVSKKAPSGESVGMGAFIISGERKWYKKTSLAFCVGAKKDGADAQLFCGAPGAVQGSTNFWVTLSFGPESKGDAAKKILGFFSKRLGLDLKGRVDEMVALLPNGNIGLVFPQ